MITETRHFDKVQTDDMSDIEGVDNSIDIEQEEIRQDQHEQEVVFTIRSFVDVDFGRSMQEYCKPYVLEPMTLDFDDVASVAVSVVRRLLHNRVDDFQLQMMQVISEICEPLITQPDNAMQEHDLFT